MMTAPEAKEFEYDYIPPKNRNFSDILEVFTNHFIQFGTESSYEYEEEEDDNNDNDYYDPGKIHFEL